MTTHGWTLEAGSFSLHHRAGRAEGTLIGPTHENPGFEVSWIERGAMAFDLGRHGRIGGTSGMSLLLPPDLLNTPRARGATTVEQILIAPDLLREAADALGSCVPSRAVVIEQGNAVSAIARAISIEHALIASANIDNGLHSMADPMDAGIEALVQALVFSLVRTRTAKRPNDEKVIEPGIRRALDHIHESHATPITIEELARTAGLSRFVFLRKFRAQVGESPYRYLTHVRLEHAARRLRNQPMTASVLEIALDCGFTDPSRFARAFAARFGTTPQRWRQEKLRLLR